jgi:hypothetical protein
MRSLERSHRKGAKAQRVRKGKRETLGQNRSAFVIPAQAGIQQGWTLRSLRSAVGWTWIPACAGMTFLFFFAYPLRIRAFAVN